MKIYELNFYGHKYHIVMQKGTYRSNGTLAIEMLEVSPKGKRVRDYFGMLTVNIADSDVVASDKYAFIDTNNNGEEIAQWLIDNKIAKNTGIKGYSGFCSYPLFKFEESVLDEMEEIK